MTGSGSASDGVVGRVGSAFWCIGVDGLNRTDLSPASFSFFCFFSSCSVSGAGSLLTEFTLDRFEYKHAVRDGSSCYV